MDHRSAALSSGRCLSTPDNRRNFPRIWLRSIWLRGAPRTCRIEMEPSLLQTDASQVTAQSEFSRPCPACGRDTDRAFRFRVNGSDIFQCRECGLGSAETSAFDPATYYTEGYFSGRRADGYSDYLGAEPVLRREFARSVDFIRRYRDRGKLLELGCAYGFFLMEAARYFDVAGIELSAEAAVHGRRAGLNVLQGMADAASLREAKRRALRQLEAAGLIQTEQHRGYQTRMRLILRKKQKKRGSKH